MSIQNYQSKLYSGHFQLLTSKDSKKSFSNRYKRFKKRSCCKSLEQVVSLSKFHLAKTEDVKELKRVLEGLRVVQEKYPKSGKRKKLMRIFNSQYRQHEEKTLESLQETIQAYERLIGVLDNNVDEEGVVDVLKEAIQARMGEIQESTHDQWKKVNALLKDNNFLINAKSVVEKMVNLGQLPAGEKLALWKLEMGKLIKEYGDKKILDTPIQVAMLFAGGKFSSELIRQMEELKQDDPGIIYPDRAQKRHQENASVFKQLAIAANLVIGEEQANTIDLLGKRYRKGDSISRVEPGGGIQNDNDQRLVLFKDVKKILTKMEEDSNNDSTKVALVNLKKGVFELFRREKNFFVEREGDIQMQKVFTVDNLEPLIEEFVFRLVEENRNELPRFAMILEKCLRGTNCTKLDTNTFFVVIHFVQAFNKYAAIDLSDALIHQSERIKEVKNFMIKFTEKRHEETVEELEIITKMCGREEQKDRVSVLNTRVDELKSRKDFQEFVNKCLNVESESDLEPLFNVFNEYWVRVFNKNDLDAKVLMFAFYEKNFDKFSEMIVSIIHMQERNIHLVHNPFFKKLCSAIDFVGGIDPGRISSVSALTAVLKRNSISGINLEEKQKLADNIKLFLEHNQWIVDLDEEQLPKGVDKTAFKDAKKIDRLLQNTPFREDVKKLFQSYNQAGLFSSTYSHRRLFIIKMKKLVDQYLKVFDPKSKDAGADDFMPFLQAVLAVEPELGAEALILISREDESVVGDPRMNIDFLYFMMYGLAEYFQEQEKFITEEFRVNKS